MSGFFPPADRAAIETLLRQIAEAAYGAERAAELSGTIRHTAEAIARVTRQPIEYRELPPQILG